MGKPSLVKQVMDRLLPMTKAGVGRSRKQDKAARITYKYIYAWSTYRSYQKHACQAAKWVKKQYSCRTLDEVREHIKEYLEERIKAGLSPYTICLDACALAKVYRCHMYDWGVDIPRRERSQITRSRGKKNNKKKFSEEKNRDVVDFNKGVGPRRHELVALKPKHISLDGSIVEICRGKGGRHRFTPVRKEYQAHVRAMRERAIREGRSKVFLSNEIKANMDIHAYRREYAQGYYDELVASGKNASGTRYYCRKDAAGISFDRGQMRAVSEALGHSRINVVAQSYLI